MGISAKIEQREDKSYAVTLITGETVHRFGPLLIGGTPSEAKERTLVQLRLNVNDAQRKLIQAQSALSASRLMLETVQSLEVAPRGWEVIEVGGGENQV